MKIFNRYIIRLIKGGILNRFVICILCCIMITACSKKSEISTKLGGDVEMYNKALKKFNKQKYQVAAMKFEEVEENHPYSKYAIKAQIMSSFCYYQIREYLEATTGLEIFLRLHPLNKYSAYGLYLNGLCYEKQTKRVQCNQDNTMMAINVYEKLINQFPHTKYARAAKVRLQALEEILAIGDYNIGIYYLKLGFYPAAIARFKDIIQNYPQSYLIDESRYRLVEAYIALGFVHYAKAYYRKLNPKWEQIARMKFAAYL